MKRRAPGSVAVAPGALVILIALVAVLATTSCQGPGPQSAPAPGSTAGATRTPSGPADADRITDADYREVRRLMHARAQAVLHHRRRAFMATVDPQQPRLLAAQRTLFHNLAALPIAELSYAVGPDGLTPASIPGGDPTFRPDIYEHLQIARTFSRPVTNDVEDTFVRRDGRWLLGAETQPTDRNAFDAPQERPWYGVPITVATDGDVTVLVDEADRDLADPLSHTVADDIVRDARLLHVPSDTAVLVDATTNGLTSIINGISKEEAGAVTFGVSATDALGSESRGLAGMVIKANPHDVEQLLHDAPTLRHELTHLLLREYSSLVPRWLSEGVAQYVGYYPDRPLMLPTDGAAWHRLLAATPKIPVSSVFGTSPSEDYAVAESAVHYLVVTFGMARLIRLMDLYRTHADPDVLFGDDLTDRLLHLAYGIGLADLTAHTWDELRALS